jgi:hypothetical protein
MNIYDWLYQSLLGVGKGLILHLTQQGEVSSPTNTFFWSATIPKPAINQALFISYDIDPYYSYTYIYIIIYIVHT